MAGNGDFYRFIQLDSTTEGTDTKYRTEYSRDYARVLHSPSFRRLQNKTQLFPGQENDFFRNRLTHSLEVSQIAKSIAVKLKKENPHLDLEPDVCEIAGMAHDIGHPPFGHNGEAALDDCMYEHGGFEGNAQTIRIVTRLEKKERPDRIIDENGQDLRVGLNLTARVIASLLKYDKVIPSYRKTNNGVVKGYYESEKPVIDKIKKMIVPDWPINDMKFKTIECSIMDIADDIAYSTYDVEDALKAEFLTPFDIIAADEEILKKIVEKFDQDKRPSIEQCKCALYGVFADIWNESVKHQYDVQHDDGFEMNTLNNFISVYEISKRLAQDGYYRTRFTSALVNSFINGVKIKINEDYPILSEVYLDDETFLRVNILKHFSYVVLINSSRLKVAENRGREIVQRTFEKIYNDTSNILMPEDVKRLYNESNDDSWRARVVCDFIAGMTDRYALEFYGRLFSETPQTIFKPL